VDGVGITATQKADIFQLNAVLPRMKLYIRSKTTLDKVPV
jgi:hypothetical protein